jgi:hypothetical protein
MTSATWAEAINLYYTLSPEVCYDGKKIIQAIGNSKWMLSLIESPDGMVNENKSLFCNNYRQEGSKGQITCFLAAAKGCGIYAAAKWTTNINNEKDLLAKKNKKNYISLYI